MRVGLPLLTLVPGISGGSETYARELCRALARVGEHEYEALRPDARARRRRAGSRPSSPPGTRASTSTPGRLRAMAQRPAPARRAPAACSSGVDVVHYPLTVPVPPRGQAHGADPARRPAPRPAASSSRAASGCSARLAYDRAARDADACRRDQRVRAATGGRAARARSRARPRDPPRASTTSASRPAPASSASRSSSTPPGPGRTRTTRACSRRSRRLREERPELRLVLTGVGHDRGRAARRGRDARRRLGRRARLALPARVGARLPEPLRGLRPAAARGDGLRLPGRRVRRRVAARGGRRRSRPLRPARAGVDRRRRSSEALDRADELRATRARPRGRLHLGRDRARPRPGLRGGALRLKPHAVGVDHHPHRARRSAPPAPSRARAVPSTRRRRGRGARRCRDAATGRSARGRASRGRRRRTRSSTSSSTECDSPVATT